MKKDLGFKRAEFTLLTEGRWTTLLLLRWAHNLTARNNTTINL